MFEKVLNGERRRTQQRTRLAFTASVAVHTLAAIGAAHIPASADRDRRFVEEVVSFVDLPLPAPSRSPAPMQSLHRDRPRPAATAPRAADAPASPSPVRMSAEAAASAPERLPAVDALLGVPAAAAATPLMRMPRVAGVGAAVAEPVGARGAVVSAEVLAERPRLANAAEMERLWQRLYPRMLEMRGITGDARVTFVIDENGRVEPETVELVSASREEFGEAVLRGVPRLRFRPMRIGGLPVRVRTTLPVLWRLRNV